MKKSTAKGSALETVLVLGDSWERLAGIALQIGDADRIVVMARSHAAVREALERNRIGLVVVDAPNEHAVKRLVLPLLGVHRNESPAVGVDSGSVRQRAD